MFMRLCRINAIYGYAVRYNKSSLCPRYKRRSVCDMI